MRYQEIDPIKGVTLSLPDFVSFLASNLRDELFARRVEPDSVDRIIGKQGAEWDILMRQTYRPLGRIHPRKVGKRTLTIICERVDDINTSSDAEQAAREYWARPDAELLALPHQWSSYDDAYRMRRCLIEDLRRVDALTKIETTESGVASPTSDWHNWPMRVDPATSASTFSNPGVPTMPPFVVAIPVDSASIYKAWEQPPSVSDTPLDLTPKRQKVLDQACIEWAGRGKLPDYNMSDFLSEINERTGEYFVIQEFKRALQDAGERGLIRKLKNRWRPI